MIIKDNKLAGELIRSKAVADPNRFRHLADDLKARGFTVAYVHNLEVRARLRDKIAALPEGGDWRAIQRDLAEEISPYMGDNEVAASKKAELLLRTHGYQAYAATRYEQQMATIEAMPYLMYITVGDGNVREEHAALDGKVLPADDPFWQGHYPPWDFGCRCVVAAVSQAGRDKIAAAEVETPPAERRVLEGQYLDELRDGRVARKDGHGYADVRLPVDKVGPELAKSAYSWSPGMVAPDMAMLKARLSAKDFKQLELALDGAGIKINTTSGTTDLRQGAKS